MSVDRDLAASRSDSTAQAVTSTGLSDCYYPNWSLVRQYAYGDVVSYYNVTQGMTEPHDFVATRTPYGAPLGSTAWYDLGPCYVIPEHQPQPPAFVGFWPEDDGLAGSLTPTLGALAASETDAQVGYWFQICSGPSGPEGEWDWCEDSEWTTTGAWVVPAGKLKWGQSYWWSVVAEDVDNGKSSYSPWTKLTVVPEQPAINSLLGTGIDGRAFNQVVGNFTEQATDAAVAAVGPPLAVTRTYNSLDPRADGMFGAGWSTRWDMRLVEEPQTKTVLITYPDGSQARFGAIGNGDYAPPQGSYATLATRAEGGWRLMDKSATSYLFDAQGRVTKVTDNRGRGQDLVYGADSRLAKVTSTGGRSLYFTWSGGHATAVSTDPVSGSPFSWSYTYDGDKLVKVCGPGSATACAAYTYADASRYSTSVLNSLPTGYWRLGEASGAKNSKLADAVGWNLGKQDANFSSGTFNAATGVSGALGGSADTAVRFAGTSASSSYVWLPEASISGSAGYLTAETWFKTTGSGVVFGQSDTASGTPSDFTPTVYVGTDGKLRAQFWNGTANPITTGAAVNNGQWHHVALTGDGAGQTLYLDGEPVGTRNGAIDHRGQRYTRLGSGYTSASWPASTSSVQVFPFKGDLDEVAIYHRSLPAAEVRAHYQAGSIAPQLSRSTLPSGRIQADNTYLPDGGRLQTHTDTNGGLWKVGALQYAADELGDPLASVTVTDPHNATLKSTHDGLRGLRTTGRTDELGKTTSFEYDTGGYLAKITDANANTTELTHDERGNQLSVTTCRSASSCQTAYASYYLSGSDRFDPRNDQLTAYRDARSASSTGNTYATKLEYNTFGEKTKVTTPATSDFPNGRSTTYSYTDGTEAASGGGMTPAGLLKTTTDPKGEHRDYAYTASGDLARDTSPTGLVTGYTYDAIGRRAGSTEISAAQQGSGVATSYGYDATGRLATVTGPGVKNEISGAVHTTQTRYTYDADGNRTGETLADITGGDPARTKTYEYDTYGRMEKVTGPEGEVVQTSYDHMGRAVSTTDAAGATYAYAYTARGESESVTLKGWTGSPTDPKPAADVIVRSNAYDPAGRLASQTDAMGRTTRFTYFNDDSPADVIADQVKLNASATPVNVVLTSSTYDAAGNLTRQVTGGGKTRVDHVYDAAGRLTSSTLDPAALNRKTAYTYDANTNVTQTVLTGAGTTRAESTSFRYETGGRLIEQTVENGATDLTTSWTVDDRGLIREIVDPRGNATGATRADYTTSVDYDALGRPVQVQGPPVKVERGGAAATTERPTARMGYNTAGEETHKTGPENRATVTAYDKAGRVASVTGSPYTPPGGTQVTPRTSFGYDAAGRVTSVTDPRGNVTDTTYDVLGRKVRVTDPAATAGAPRGNWDFTYTLTGEELSATDPTGARTEATYDGLGRQVTATQIERRPAAAAYTTVMEYDTAGRQTAVKRPAGNRTQLTVNAAGEVVTQTDALNHADAFAYDPAGRTVKITDALGNSTATEYDLAGRKTTAKDLNASGTVLRTFGFAYDAAGNLTTQTSPEGHATRRTFDAADRLVQLVESVAAGKDITTSFGYNAASERTRTTDGRGSTFLTTYNSLGLVESRIEPSTPAHPGLADRTWTASYDQAGNPVSVLQPGGVQITNAYDNLNRLIGEAGSGAEVTTQGTAFGYDLAGRRTSAGDLAFTYNDRGLLLSTAKAGTPGTLSTFAYDANQRPAQRTDAAGTATLTWDDADRLKTLSDPLTATTLTYGYDNADRLTGITYGTGPKRTYTYDPMDRLTGDSLKSAGNAAMASITYGYDRDDNLTTKTTSGTAGAGTNTYTYDFANRLTSWTAPGGAVTDYAWDDSGNRVKAGDQTFTYDERNRLLSGGGSTYTYTPRGTLATQTIGATSKNLRFDAFDRMISDGEATYTYDALDRVTSRIHGTVVSRYLYGDLANDIVATTDAAGTTQARYSRGVDGDLIGISDGTGPRLAFTDQHGDLVGTFGATATALADSVAYAPFGEEITRAGARHELGYQGELTDADSGKVNMHARWYQPGTATFASRDTASLAPDPSIQANRYGYVHGSPLTGTDPSGHTRTGIYCVTCPPDPPVIMPGYMCTTKGICVMPDVEQRWWNDYINSPGFEYYNNPLLSDEEVKRLGYKFMPNGRPVDQPNFWFADEKVQNAYMEHWSPTLGDRELNFNWAAVGGLESMRTMMHAIKARSSDPRIPSCARGWTHNGPPRCKDFPNLNLYMNLLEYYGYIQKAASKYGVDKNALTALIIYENMGAETKAGKVGAWGVYYARKAQGKGATAGLGITQMEIYKAREMFKRYHPDKANLSDDEIAKILIDQPGLAIDLAAAYLSYLKWKITINDHGAKRHINDWEATLAYCGCSGVVWRKGKLDFDRFQDWLEDKRSIPADLVKRRDALYGPLRSVADEYWKCVRLECFYLDRGGLW
ncbi:LamG-like jellyroll fold domain-containing protein [Sphaerisporangium rufum]|uniref:LamG-like jellyroll fold domain-containing protein n=1 Tax=Sphaerisporangium rufum TaxID=1381558 RepID=UPI001950C7FA|nr:LamG-like jellyroll fold domain-containing protein [Sphaerisporangium rufum]